VADHAALQALRAAAVLAVAEEGLEVEKDDVFGTVEAVKTVSELYAPLSGEISEINESLEDEPEAVNNDPYGDGWMVKIEMSDESELEDLLSVDEYQEIIA
jgi:glycine cleavage system H protein